MTEEEKLATINRIIDKMVALGLVVLKDEVNECACIEESQDSSQSP